CVLHYRANDAPLRDGDLLLIDAGAEYACYASDITRTFPVNGRFSPEQRALYDVVLAAQLAAIDEVRPGRPFDAYHEAAVRVIARGLVRLGLLEGGVDRVLREQSYRKFYMHKTGHWLGLDVHDVGDYRIDGEFRVLEPGMVVTVEPGLYVAPDLKGVSARWRGIGIRIEDDVVVTRGDPDVLSAGVPKDADAIEALMASRG
ncbi:MAG TPA: M24B family metallopeptidase, partial [Dokdonella sp.]